jgi:histidine triad (HIT) family protein
MMDSMRESTNEPRAVATCAFCQIAAGTSPAAKVYETADLVAFLDTRPLFPGHCLLIPRPHFETLTGLPKDRVESLFTAARLLAAAVESAVEAEGSFVAINNRVSQSVPHLHVHIVPRRKKDGLKGFFWPRNKYVDDTQFETIHLAIVQAVERLLQSM